MEFNLVIGWVAGLAGAIAMTVLMKMGTSMGMSSMPDMAVIQGAMFTDDERTAKRIGVFTHLVMLGALVFGTVYAALFAMFGTASWLAGLGIGVVHGLMAGAVGMPMMGSMHPRMQPAEHLGGAMVRADVGGLRIAEPGFFGRNYGAGTPMGLIMGHAAYGLVLAVVYNALV
ncbi:MAG: hypothetical protein M3O70_12920 [Actinomycetota bacterium]|nr:hypothetical protein [Actinomycetota bacterium]